jgi:hypothetical protein
MPFRFQFPGKTATAWAAANPVILARELAVETDTGKFKVGDGVTPWNSLPYGGIKGDAGPAGATGPVGPPGTQGVTGPAGPQGVTGAASAVPGPKGDKGETGDVGPRGPAGADSVVPGPQGPIGLTGPAGPQGPKGDTGNTGPQGIQGIQGLAGPAGSDGAPGAQGAQGTQGPKGDTGDQGPQGIQGVQGPAGPTVGYCINVQALTSSPTDAQTVYFGTLPKAPVTTAATSKIYIRKAGTIKIAEIYCYSGTAGTNESWSLYIRKNNTTDTLIATVGANTNERVFSNAALNIAVAAGDYIEIKGVQPTWATNPLTTIYGGYIYIE